MKLALRPAHYFSPALCSRAPSPAQSPPWVPHRLRSEAWRSGPGPPPQLPVRRRPGSFAAALGMLRDVRGGRFASPALALGGRWADERLQLELGRPELELPGVSPPPPSLRARQPEPAREPREAASQHPSQSSLVRSPARGSPREGASPLGRVPRAGTARARTGLHENSLRVLLSCSTMSAKSAISKEIFAPLDERMLGAVQVKRRTKKKIPFLATGGQGEYLTYICLSVTNKKPTQASITKVKQFEGSTSFVRRSQWMLEQLRQVNGIDPNRDSAEFDLLFENAFDQWVASTASEKCTFFQILHHTCQRYLTDRKPEFINCQSKIMGEDRLGSFDPLMPATGSRGPL
ncbi:syntaxin-binding protein 6 isoform X2 [Desmodus rotundus]|uniref:syntaxin-binding protein 6 isoform X2 n=1 Tax=Desmodus rotundus TaxID=9430 RepID=UPI0023813B71|nr:syntaxin-binding protein 6 isoform X2 [Desmodus rotundus]